ncbi:putative Mg2+ transporter-C (MgtC) family protein [Saccharopolyspora erythraea NRRL 2338]|uniref:Mg2+ transporter-C (MgtC) family protein n=2 Tax=Saccharopolyspora erythraea TaxID=1836 RepID=A4FG86_SACEN|nr:MgtC/SapB family protein [Saccharopolyspora erythraea]EQD81569.1 magnesium transporter MgtC [Saccharopolyspora erythraea D]PFG96766.1 putative Mg2+ transporter-C (MgtC) family protein [Saccharopolyspora erythraea NRRL 2338]QRK87015.1 MgtC/SapB family protein [Saccharopolyspora erythraea]CAM03061.1 putative Mg2+ transporter-C (MgtC) family protein [Saccharopolyspora erythraea NRRL 2338]
MPDAVVSGFREVPLLVELGAALLLSSLIGLEREIRAKSAGMRTHALVGVGAAVFMLVSKYAFGDLLVFDRVSFDPSRVAAQVVSGIGFIGGGLIFVRRDAVRGLTTAATVWVVAAVGMACGGGLFLLAVATTAAHFAVVLGYPRLLRLVRRSLREPQVMRIGYLDGYGVLRGVLTLCTSRGWRVLDLEVEREDTDDQQQRVAVVAIRVSGKEPVSSLVGEVGVLPGVLHAAAGESVEPGF